MRPGGGKKEENEIKTTIPDEDRRFWQRTVILIETLKGGASSVQRGVQFSN